MKFDISPTRAPTPATSQTRAGGAVGVGLLSAGCFSCTSSAGMMDRDTSMEWWAWTSSSHSSSSQASSHFHGQHLRHRVAGQIHKLLSLVVQELLSRLKYLPGHSLGLGNPRTGNHRSGILGAGSPGRNNLRAGSLGMDNFKISNHSKTSKISSRILKY